MLKWKPKGNGGKKYIVTMRGQKIWLNPPTQAMLKRQSLNVARSKRLRAANRGKAKTK